MSRSRLLVMAWLAGAIVAAAPMLRAQSKPGLSAKAKAQIDSVRQAVAQFANPRVAEDSGYEPVFGLVPLQGVHYVRSDLIKGGKFDLTRPPVLTALEGPGPDPRR